MNVKIAVDILIEIFLLIAGYSQIAKGVAYGMSEEKYTKESIKKFSKPMGLITWAFALALGMIFVGQAGVLKPRPSVTLMYAGDIAVVLVLIIYFLASSKILKKKQGKMGYSYKKNNRKL